MLGKRKWIILISVIILAVVLPLAGFGFLINSHTLKDAVTDAPVSAADQAIKIATPSIDQYATENNRTIKTVNTKFYNATSTKGDAWEVVAIFDLVSGTGAQDWIDGYTVSIWADSGEIYYAGERGYYSSSTIQSKGGFYLHFPSGYQGGAETKAYLIDSQLYYGIYNQRFTRSGATGSYSINNGDACVIINGTIRNDYDNDYYFAITANVNNAAGGKIEPILTANSPEPGYTVAHINKGSTGSFELQIRYDVKDAANYDLFLAFEQSDVPPA